MPTATAGLFGGLAQGIFGRMREHEDEQRKMDFDEKKTALTSLSSLLEHATPETRPTIYKQMSDVMGLKGKHRGVWDMLTGGGRDDYHQQLSSKLDGVFGNIMGPKAYEEATTAAPTSGNQADWGDESAGLTYTPPAGKIALRDPVAEHLAALKGQYGLQNDRRSQEIELRDRLQSRRELDNDNRDALNKQKDRELAADIASEKKVRVLAKTMALKRQSQIPSDEEMAAAAEQIALLDGLNVDKLKAQIGFLESGSRRNDAQAQAGGAGGRPETESQKKTFDANQRLQAQGVFGQWNKHNAERAKADQEQGSLRTQLNNIATSIGAKFDETGKKFVETLPNGASQDVDLITVMVPGMSTKKIMELIDRVHELQAIKEGHFKEMGGLRDTLTGQFPGLYDSPDEYTIRVNPNMGGLAPAGAPRATIYDATTPKGTKKPIPGQITVPRKTNDPSYDRNEGDVINYLGKQYKVHEVLPPGGGMEFGGVVLIPLGKGK